VPLYRMGRRISLPDSLGNSVVEARHIGNGQVTTPKIPDGAVTTPKMADGAVTGPKTANTFIQAGSASVSFPFAAAGVEVVSVSVTFPTSFPTGVVPQLAVEVEGPDVHVVRVVVTETGFTIYVSDTITDYATSQSAVVRWIAIAKS